MRPVFCRCTLNGMYKRNGNIGNWSLSEQTRRILKSKSASSQSLIIRLQVSHSAHSEAIKFIAQLTNFPRRSVFYCLNGTLQTYLAVEAALHSPFNLPPHPHVSLRFARTVVIHFRSSSSLFEAHVEQRWPLFIRLCGSELCCLIQSWNCGLQSAHHSLERHELFPCLLPSPTHCTTNSAETTNIISSASASLRKAHDTLSITDAKSPQQAVLMWSLPAWRQERREMLQRVATLPPPPPPHTRTHTRRHRSHTLSSSHIPLLLLSTVINTYSGWNTHTHQTEESYFSFSLCSLPKVSPVLRVL